MGRQGVTWELGPYSYLQIYHTYSRRRLALETALPATAIPLTGEDSAKDTIPMQEVARHNLAHDAWVVVDGHVYE